MSVAPGPGEPARGAAALAPASPVLTFAGPDDAEACAAVIAEMDAHYRALDGATHALPPVETYAAEIRGWIEAREGAHFLLARAGAGTGARAGARDGALDGAGAPMGVACVSVLRPGHVLQGLVFLKDLYVMRAHRRAGVGEALLRGVLDWARAEGLGRVDLTVSPENPAARALYARFGGQELTDRLFTRFDL
ncbi:MAG: GNAT family N-acetyltransferase [Pseudomonadota bacterium]